jgi:NTE family protein
MSDSGLGWLSGDSIRVGRRRKGFNVTEILDLPETVRDLILEITRREPVRLSDLAESLGRSSLDLEVQLSQLVAQGWLGVEENEFGEWEYRVRMARGRKPLLPPGTWQVIEDRWEMPIFRTLADALRDEFVQSFELKDYGPGAVLFESGVWDDRLYVIESGVVELCVYNEAGERFVFRTIGAGGVLGELAVLHGQRRAFDAHIAQESRIWVLAKPDLDQLLARHPAMALQARRALTRLTRLSSRAGEAADRKNPVLAVGEAGSELARHLAEQVHAQVVLIDLCGQAPPPTPNLSVLDGRGMHTAAIARAIQDHLQTQAWVVIAALPEMTDSLMRVAGLSQIVIDMTGSGVPWLRAATQHHWVVPSSTPRQVARLARRLCGHVTGLALSGGLAHTLAHLGVLDVLHQSGVDVDAIAGCGYGALWGVLYAAEWSPDELIELAQREAGRLRPSSKRLGLGVRSRLGLFDARPLRSWIHDLVQERRFSDLETPCYLATGDLETGEVVWVSEGKLFNALSASIAAPGLTTPVQYQDRLLVNALLSEPMPVKALSSERADIVLASSVIPLPGRDASPPAARDTNPDLVTTWMEVCGSVAQSHVQDHLQRADVIIAPDVSGVHLSGFDRVEALVERGRHAAREALPHIRASLRGEERLL